MRQIRKPRQLRKHILVVCEGETEEAYFSLLRKHFRLPIKIKIHVAGQGICKRDLDSYKADIDSVSASMIDTFLVYDADVESVVSALSKLEGRPLLTNPCFEFWLMLHTGDYSKSISTAGALKRLCESASVWANYKKGILTAAQEKHLIENLDYACQRARKLKGNPSSEIYLFIDHLRSL